MTILSLQKIWFQADKLDKLLVLILNLPCVVLCGLYVLGPKLPPPPAAAAAKKANLGIFLSQAGCDKYNPLECNSKVLELGPQDLNNDE